jgi:hypothetical protein
MDGSPFRAVAKPMRGGSVATWSQGRWGENLGEVERYGRIGRRTPGNTGPIGTDSPDAQTLEVAGRDRELPWQVAVSVNQTTRREGGVERRRPLPVRETLRKRKPKGVTGMK